MNKLGAALLAQPEALEALLAMIQEGAVGLCSADRD